jgi:arylsulfatase A-like enzyme
MLADDFGHNNWQHSNPSLISPNLDTLVAEGMLLKRHYVYKVC